MKMTLAEAVRTDEFLKLWDVVIDDGGFVGQHDGNFFAVVTSWNVVNLVEKEVARMVDVDERSTFDDIVYEYLLTMGDNVDQHHCWGFDDEYEYCTGCYVIVRTSPTHYGWLPEYVRDPEYGELFCKECLLKEPDWYINDVLKNNSDAANTIIPTEVFEEMGFERYYGGYPYFETGWHQGQNDRPDKVLKQVHEEGYKDCIFNIVSRGQFDTRWEAWVRKEEPQEE